MNNDLISREALKEAIIETFGIYFDGTYDNRKILKLIDNAPTVAVNCKDCDGYEAGYSAGLKDAERPQDDIFPMEIVTGKCPIEAGGNCPLKSQGELIELTDEVWKLYKKHQSHLATYVLEFGEELADLLGKYNEGGAE